MNDLSDPLSNKKQTALFGPNLGIISGGPKWTEANQKKVVADQLTPEIVKSWIAKSKEVRSLSSLPGRGPSNDSF
jgi:hypothetical protein